MLVTAFGAKDLVAVVAFVNVGIEMLLLMRRQDGDARKFLFANSADQRAALLFFQDPQFCCSFRNNKEKFLP